MKVKTRFFPFFYRELPVWFFYLDDWHAFLGSFAVSEVITSTEYYS